LARKYSAAGDANEHDDGGEHDRRVVQTRVGTRGRMAWLVRPVALRILLPNDLAYVLKAVGCKGVAAIAFAHSRREPCACRW
jgi:hypothetical protein